MLEEEQPPYGTAGLPPLPPPPPPREVCILRVCACARASLGAVRFSQAAVSSKPMEFAGPMYGLAAFLHLISRF